MYSRRQINNVFRVVLLGSILSAIIAVAIALTGGTKVSAYTCEWSNNGGGTFTTGSDYTGDLELLYGNCVVMKPVDRGPPATGAGCVDQTQRRHDDGFCWTYQPEYTNLKPTLDDGTEVPQSTWEAMCGQERHVGQGSDGPLNYNSDLHRCENDGFPWNGCTFNDNNDINNNLTVGSCTAIEDPEKELTLEDEYADTTGAAVDACKSAKVSYNRDTKDCNWSPETCPQKNGGQGHWNEAQQKCNSFSDYTNQQECEANGGAWLVNPDDPTHRQCQKPGTEFDDGEDKKADGAGGVIGQAVGKCGKARVNLLECEAGEGADSADDVFTQVLRIGVIALSTVVGAAALAGLVWSALTYARASDDQSTVSDAKDRIRNIVIGLFLYGFIIAIANFLVPGGIL